MDNGKPVFFIIAKIISVLMIMGGIAAVAGAKGVFQEATGILLSSMGFLTLVVSFAARHAVHQLWLIQYEVNKANRERVLVTRS